MKITGGRSIGKHLIQRFVRSLNLSRTRKSTDSLLKTLFIGYRYPSSDDRKLKYDVKALKGVIFGIKTSEYDKCQIIKKILKNKKIGDDFQFWQAEYNDEKQTIEIREKLWKLKDFRGKVVSE